MNNLRKIGLSALAGSLATFSVNAADVTVSGGASLSFDDTDRGGNTGTGTRGNGFYMGDSLGFNMSGETENGLGVAVYYEIDGGALDDYDMTVSGDWGSVKFNGSGSSSAFGAVDDVTPNAYEESWDIIDDDGTSTTGSPTVIGGGGGANMFIYTSPSMGGATFTAAYQNDGGGVTVSESYTDFAIAISPEMVEGLSLGYASSDNQVGVSTDIAKTTMYAKYAIGSFTVGVQQSDYDHTTANSDQESTAMGVTYAVNDNFSVGYNEHTVDFESTSLVDQESDGVSASYTMGGVTLGGAMNSTANIAGSSGRDNEGYEFTLSFAF